jgi:hypothetical protein
VHSTATCSTSSTSTTRPATSSTPAANDWFDYCQPGDIYGNADIRGTYLKQGYDLVTPLSLMDPFTMIAQIAASLAGWLHSTNHLNFWGPQTPTTVNV